MARVRRRPCFGDPSSTRRAVVCGLGRRNSPVLRPRTTGGRRGCRESAARFCLFINYDILTRVAMHRDRRGRHVRSDITHSARRKQRVGRYVCTVLCNIIYVRACVNRFQIFQNPTLRRVFLHGRVLSTNYYSGCFRWSLGLVRWLLQINIYLYALNRFKIQHFLNAGILGTPEQVLV